MPNIKSLSPNYKVVNDIKEGDFYFGQIVDLVVCYVDKRKFEKSTKESVEVKKPIIFEDIDTDSSYLKLEFVFEKVGKLPNSFKDKDENSKVIVEYSRVVIYKVAIKQTENNERYRTMITGSLIDNEKFKNGYNDFTKLCLKFGAFSESDLLPGNYAKLKPFEDIRPIFIGKDFKFKFLDKIARTKREFDKIFKTGEQININSIQLISI